MRSSAQHATTEDQRAGGGLVPALCGVLGGLLVAMVLALALVLAVPQVLGWELYGVVSGSMEPAIPVGSAVFVRPEGLGEVGLGSVIAFGRGGGVVTHRVVGVNEDGLLITQGDANDTADLLPVGADELVGEVVAHVPVLGRVLLPLSSMAGKVALLALGIAGLLLRCVAVRLRAQGGAPAEADASTVRVGDAEAQGTGSQAVDAHAALRVAASDAFPVVYGSALPTADGSVPPARETRAGGKARQRGALILRVVAVAATAVFLASAAYAFYLWERLARGRSAYGEKAATYVRDAPATTGSELPPREIDFDALRKEAPAVVGWIWCPGTAIDYPVVQGPDNGFYLSHAYDDSSLYSGSIFVDASCAPDFSYANSIVYGHRMTDGSMFGSLPEWSNQAYFDEHPYLWLFTPGGTYRLDIVAGRTVDAHDPVYTVFSEPGEEFTAYLGQAVASSDFVSGVEPDPTARYVLLSTCYRDNLADGRYILHAKLVPVD